MPYDVLAHSTLKTQHPDENDANSESQHEAHDPTSAASIAEQQQYYQQFLQQQLQHQHQQQQQLQAHHVPGGESGPRV